MCRPSCCSKSTGDGAGIAAVAVVTGAAIVAVKTGPIVARILHLIAEVLTIITLTAATALACILLGWLTVRIVRWRLAAITHTGRRPCGRFPPRPAAHRPGRTATWVPRLRRHRHGAARHQRQPLPGPALPGMRTRPAGRVIIMPQRSSRNHRNNPYVLDRAFAQVHHSAAGAIWRFRTELATLTAGTAGAWELARTVTAAWMLVILTARPWWSRYSRGPGGLSCGGRGACCPGTASSGSASRPGCTQGPGGCPWSCASPPLRSGNAR